MIFTILIRFLLRDDRNGRPVSRDNLSIEYLENGGDAEEALKLFSVEMRKNLEERIIA